MPTGQQIVTQALVTLGIVEQGGTPSVSASNSALAELNNMWQAWGIDEGLINAVVPFRFPVNGSVSYYGLGASGNYTFFGLYPARVYNAFFITVTGGSITAASPGAGTDGGTGYAVGDTGQILEGSGTRATYTVTAIGGSGNVMAFTVTTTGSGYTVGIGYATQNTSGVGQNLNIIVSAVSAQTQNRNEMNLVNSDRFFKHRDLSAVSSVPEDLYIDFANASPSGYIAAYLWPIPTGNGTLELSTAMAFQPFTLTQNVFIPYGYGDAINYALAFRLIAQYGVAVVQSILETVTAEAQKSELRIREMNKTNRQLAQGAEMLEAPQPAKGA